jgi:hypothetical protein
MFDGEKRRLVGVANEIVAALLTKPPGVTTAALPRRPIRAVERHRAGCRNWQRSG